MISTAVSQQDSHFEFWPCSTHGCTGFSYPASTVQKKQKIINACYISWCFKVICWNKCRSILLLDSLVSVRVLARLYPTSHLTTTAKGYSDPTTLNSDPQIV